MVKITNGAVVLEVSKGAFENVYKKQGYEIFKGNLSEAQKRHEKQEKQVEKQVEAETKTSHVTPEEFSDKPLSEWKKADILEYCRVNNFDISKATNIREAREILKKHINNTFKHEEAEE